MGICGIYALLVLAAKQNGEISTSDTHNEVPVFVNNGARPLVLITTQ